MTAEASEEQNSLIIAAEDFPEGEFLKAHRFSANDDRIISKLLAHGPVLLQGGRGSGKSALMRMAQFRSFPYKQESGVFAIYVSLRHLPLLRSEGEAYHKFLFQLLSIEVMKLSDRLATAIPAIDLEGGVTSVRESLNRTAQILEKRIVVLFDDAAHIGREAPLADFFDIFRTLASSRVSCKATIYPGVTHFGNRFDVYNDASVIDVTRSVEQPGFSDLFSQVLEARFPSFLQKKASPPLNHNLIARFLGQCVVGNMRGFVIACRQLNEIDDTITVSTLGSVLLALAQNHYWPLFEEVSPKLGKYEAMAAPAQEIMRRVLTKCAQSRVGNRSVVIHKDLIAKYAKPFEILEYVGFLARKEASRAMKSGGRGVRFGVNLCILLEEVKGARLSRDRFTKWNSPEQEFAEVHKSGTDFKDIECPEPDNQKDLAVLTMDVDKLAKSNIYPYGLSAQQIDRLKTAGFKTIGEVAEAPDQRLDGVYGIGKANVQRIRNVINQAIWM